MPVKLFDLRKKDYPDDVEFRTLQVHTCQVCSSRTNLAINTGFPGTYLSPLCPNVSENWHTMVAELKDATLAVEKINSARTLLVAEITRILDMHRAEIIDNIIGRADRSLSW